MIAGALAALDSHRDHRRVETDDLSTLIVGPPETLFPARRDLFVVAASSGTHCVLSATVSRGCPAFSPPLSCFGGSNPVLPRPAPSELS
ncbi:MAG: hypothetical protein JJ920_04195 [Roseitalea sp.]|nr:hypothetical protein [Roseitalea sp.]MBO6721530.1 hypothetical protein [Roseitalea sp.]MBO6742087.1 hypothetical protein [Roseitalea sp.]